MFSTPEFIKNSVPFFHSKLFYLKFRIYNFNNVLSLYITVILQFPYQLEENVMSLINLKVDQFNMNIDPMLFNWLVYIPKINKHKEVKKKISVSDLAFFR